MQNKCCNELRGISFTRQVVEQSSEIPIKKGCFAILVTNIVGVGGSVAIVEGFPLNPPLAAGANGESWTVGGVPGTYITKQSLEIVFSTGVGRVFVQQLYYNEINSH